MISQTKKQEILNNDSMSIGETCLTFLKLNKEKCFHKK